MADAAGFSRPFRLRLRQNIRDLYSKLKFLLLLKLSILFNLNSNGYLSEYWACNLFNSSCHKISFVVLLKNNKITFLIRWRNNSFLLFMQPKQIKVFFLSYHYLIDSIRIAWIKSLIIGVKPEPAQMRTNS